jgi:serine/threonine protein kinase
MIAPVNIGDVLAGKYQVEAVLGAGGMGIVVAARHMQLEERVAIKFLQPEALKQSGVATRFLREGRAAVKIRSEHVARVYDVGSLESGLPYLVMEYLDGQDLAALLEVSGPLSIEDAAEYMLQTCEALAAAHAIGIVHRDIKPSNLFITVRVDGSPAIKVLDFGISKLAPGFDADGALTSSVEIRGSPHFMSPEQMTSTRDVDVRSDIWSIGVTLYNLLTGGYPFNAGTLPQLCLVVLHHPPEPIVDKRADVPLALCELILRCLRKDPKERFQSVAELAAGLAPFAPAHARASAERIARVLRPGAVGVRTSTPGHAQTPLSPRASSPVRVIYRSLKGPLVEPKGDLSWDDTIPQPMAPAPEARSAAPAVTVDPVPTLAAVAAPAAPAGPPSAPASGVGPPWYRLSSRGLMTAVGVASVLALALALALLIVTFRR